MRSESIRNNINKLQNLCPIFIINSHISYCMNSDPNKPNQVNKPVQISNANYAQQQNSSTNYVQQQSNVFQIPASSSSNNEPEFVISNPSFQIPQQQYQINSLPVQNNVDLFSQQQANYNPYVQQQSNPYVQQQSLFSNLNVQPQIYQQQNYQQSYNQGINQQVPYGNLNFVHGNNSQFRLLNDKEQDKQKQVVAVIITLNSNGSYDHLFSSVQQKSLEGTRVLVYAGDSMCLQKLIKAFEGNAQDQTMKSMMGFIKQLHSDCVVFNWECCGGYGSQTFPEGKQNLFKFLKLIIDRGHMAMFSDFSLKSLIAEWDQHQMGPNPFVKIGETSNPFQIRFKAGDLKQCPSAQLQIVGQMANEGRCNISVLGGTIVYSVDHTKLNHDIYKLKVLTVNTTEKIQNKDYLCKIGQFQGAAGHILLTYKSGGNILTSMGHWIELMKIDTSEHKLFQVAERQYGKQYAQNLKMQYASLDVNQQKSWVYSNAVNFVQNQAPCSNMNQKAYKKG